MPFWKKNVDVGSTIKEFDSHTSCPICVNEQNFNTKKSEFILFPPVNYSMFFGPTIDETIIRLLFFLPFKIIEKLDGCHKAFKCLQNLKRHKNNYVEDTNATNNVNIKQWLNERYKELANDILEANLETREANSLDLTPEMLRARKFVLNRLAELMLQKEKLSKDEKNCKQRE